jgi:O-antigen ligase
VIAHTATSMPPTARSLCPDSKEGSTGFLEWATLVHVAVFVVVTTWAFGGQADFVRVPLAGWGTLSLPLALANLRRRGRSIRLGSAPLVWLWPFFAFNVLVAIANFNPSFRAVASGADTMLVYEGGRAGWPTSARPMLAWQALWLFDAIWLTCFNLAWIIRRRRSLRTLLVIAFANATVLSVFGTVQKFGHATGIFFDAVPTRQTYFFASFVYHNHWAAFSLLMLGVGAGLVWHLGRRHHARDVFHSPAFIGSVATLLIAATIPLSGSRSGTILLGLFALGPLLHWATRLVQARQREYARVAWPLTVSMIVVVLAIMGVWYVARDTIRLRVALTKHQVAEMEARGSVGSRAMLYRNTWRMAAAKPWFGWGMASYPHVFMLYNTQESPIDRLPVFYRDAHSDWLQALAEHGFLGATLLGLCGCLPLASLFGRDPVGPLPRYLLFACGLIMFYAWIEFPFGNVAVVLCWWFSLFTAVQYVRLSRDAVSDRPAQQFNATA